MLLMLPAPDRTRSAMRGIRKGIAFLSSNDIVRRKTKMNSKNDSIGIIPMFSIDAKGNEAAFSVKTSVRPVR